MELCVADIGVEQLVERYGGRAYRLAWRITGEVKEAEAVTQNALLRAACSIQFVADEPALDSWIFRAVACDAAERRRRRHPGDEAALEAVVEALPVDGGHFEPMEDWSARVGEPILQRGLQTVIGEAIDALPADYRTALVLHDVEGISRPAIADALDVETEVVKARVHRARLFVRHRLSEYFETAPANINKPRTLEG
jgi:RNA polymerase sigma-70 factor, ECF subfamily